jgi:hypothetical protein
MRVVENRVAIDDVQPTWGNDLNFRFETTFDVVKLGRFALLRPSLSLGNVDEVYDRALDSLIGANPDHRLLAGASAGFHILGRNDLFCRHVATIDDDPLNGSAIGNGADFVRLRGRTGERYYKDRKQTK